MTSTFDSHPPTDSKRSGRRFPRWAGAVAAVALLAAGCSSGPGTQEEFETVLMDTAGFTESQASCVATAVFEEYEAQEDALGTISAAPSFEFLEGEDGVPGFSEFFEGAVQECTPVGPVSE